MTTTEILPTLGALRLNLNLDFDIWAINRTDANGTAPVRVRPDTLPHVLGYQTLRTNLITNPSFEVDTAGWTLTGVTASAGTYFPEMIKAGAKNVQMVSTGTSINPSARMDEVPVSAGQWFGFKAFLASEVTGDIRVRLAVQFKDAANAALATPGTAYTRAPFYTGASLEVVAQAPAGAVKATVYLQFQNGAAPAANVASGIRVWSDAIVAVAAGTQAEVVAQLAGPYFDGSTAATGELSYAWTGAANASTSIERTPTTFTVDDYEAAAGPVSYTITGYRADFSAAAYTLNAAMTLDGPWLGVPIMQTYSQRLESVLEYAAEVPGRNSTIEPLNRADPIVVLRRMGLRRGDVRLWAGTHAAALSIIGALSKGEVMMLRQPEHAGMDMYFVAGRAGVTTLATDAADTIFSVAVTYQEVARPLGNLAAAPGWDFATLAATYPDFLTIAGTYPDFASLTLNEPAP